MVLLVVRVVCTTIVWIVITEVVCVTVDVSYTVNGSLVVGV